MLFTRSFGMVATILSLVALVAGCQSSGMSRLFSRQRDSDGLTVVDRSQAAPTRDSGTSPEASSAKAADAPMASKTDQNPFRSAATTPASTASAEPSNRAMLVEIEREFRDAAPEEREEWFRLLADVPPEQVPQILQIRRLTKEREAAARAAADRVQTAALTMPPTGPGMSPAQAAPVIQPAGYQQTQASTVAPGEPVQLMGIEGASPVTPGEFAPSVMTGPPQAPWVNPSVPGATLPSIQPGPVTGPLPGPATPAMPVNNSGGPSTSGVFQNASLSRNGGPTIVSRNATNPGAENPSGLPLYQDLSWDEQLARLVSVAERQFPARDRVEDEAKLDYITQQVHLRMLYLMSGQQQRAMQAIPGIPAPEQEFWQQTFWAITNYFDDENIPDSTDRMTQVISLLSTAIDRLRENSQLEIRTAVFCRKIDGFGVYERFERDEFEPGQTVLLYAEAQNFFSEPNADGRYRTVLNASLEFYRAGLSGGLIKTIDLPAKEDLSQSRRHDYFNGFLFSIPDEATLGPHTLKITLEDELSHKIATTSVNFTVIAK